jgi:uncharacterized metal-binding protein
MASGRNHDHATALWSLPWGLVVALVLGWQGGLIAAASFLIGGLWLSPDLDTRSLALHRWGALQWLWWPYRTLLPHRSFWSHGPVIGTLLRLLLLLGWAGLVMALLPGPSVSELIQALVQGVRRHPSSALAVLLSLEASVWLHLLLDGDPWPSEWRRQRRR